MRHPSRKQFDAQVAGPAARALPGAVHAGAALLLALACGPLAAQSSEPLITTQASADTRQAFSTRHAHFLPAAWHDLPGWRDDDLTDAWRAFLQSCSALARRPGWEAPCTRARGVRRDNGALREFFEREFLLYEIRNADRSPDGVITGYYEPLLTGSRSRQGSFVHPVYATPADLLTLDVRLWPKALRGRPVAARIEGRTVIPTPDAAGPYLIDVGDLAPDDRDKKLRLRLDGERLVPYFTRAEIERDAALRAPVLAWVDNPAALYSMQIQGSGKIRLTDGSTLRLAYAEQNGHPFRPPVVAGASAPNKRRITTRGLSIELPDAEDEAPDIASDGERDAEPLTRGSRVRAPTAVADAEVERVIRLLGGGDRRAEPAGGSGVSPAAGRAQPPTPPATARREPAPAPRPNANPNPPPPTAPAPVEAATFARPSAQALAAISRDPSFVFFREIPDGPGGPIGALGVALTAGRSVAVDPRTTPLGFPVFLATARTGDGARFSRLMMAQDTGGAIRGAVRADYFWGFGAGAYAQAARMKENGRMWLLMPSGQPVEAREQATLTRGKVDPAAMPDCVVADPELCVEDR